jgi:hypothetical protein
MNYELKIIWKEAACSDQNAVPEFATSKFRIDGILAEIRTKHLPNMCLEHYVYSSPLCPVSVVFSCYVRSKSHISLKEKKDKILSRFRGGA